MRPLLPGDLDQAVRVLLAAGDRRARARRLLAEAGAADRFRRATGRAHPRWGDGSLMAAAMRHAAPPLPDHVDADWRAALADLLAVLAEGDAVP